MKDTLGTNMKILTEYNMKPSLNYKGIAVPMKPPKVEGYISKIGKLMKMKNLRYFCMNPIEFTFIKYIKKEDYPKKPKDVYCLYNISGLNRVIDPDTSKGYFIEVRLS